MTTRSHRYRLMFRKSGDYQTRLSAGFPAENSAPISRTGIARCGKKLLEWPGRSCRARVQPYKRKDGSRSQTRGGTVRWPRNRDRTDVPRNGSVRHPGQLRRRPVRHAHGVSSDRRDFRNSCQACDAPGALWSACTKRSAECSAISAPTSLPLRS
jgi:hypothetical protein